MPMRVLRQCRRLALYLHSRQFSSCVRLWHPKIQHHRGLGLGVIVPDGVACAEANPLRNRAVLLLRFGKLLLGAEGLLALYFVRSCALSRVQWLGGKACVPAS